jgi:hypothetical protein
MLLLLHVLFGILLRYHLPLQHHRHHQLDNILGLYLFHQHYPVMNCQDVNHKHSKHNLQQNL